MSADCQSHHGYESSHPIEAAADRSVDIVKGRIAVRAAIALVPCSSTGSNCSDQIGTAPIKRTSFAS
jgi:hypothetical protein